MKKIAKWGFSELAEVNTWKYARDLRVLFWYAKIPFTGYLRPNAQVSERYGSYG